MPSDGRATQAADDQPRLVARPAQPQSSAPEPARGRSPGLRFRLRGGVQKARPRCSQERPLRGHDRLAGMVAGRLGPLRRPLHPDGVACRRHLPGAGRPRRRLDREPALCAAQQLARQRQPRQGAPAALADQAAVRPPDLLGRPVHPRRQLRPRVHGLRDLRLRRWPGGHLGARGGHRLGRRGRLAR